MTPVTASKVGVGITKNDYRVKMLKNDFSGFHLNQVNDKSFIFCIWLVRGAGLGGGQLEHRVRRALKRF